MIGTLIFADIPLAIWPEEEPNWGWSDKCPEKNIWNKVPANEDQWSAQVRASNVWNKRLPETSVWQKQQPKTSAWANQDSRVEDHNKC